MSSPKIMGVFAISKYNAAFAMLFGMFLFGLNFRVVFVEFEGSEISWWQILLFLVYTALLVKVILEPVSDLR